MSTQGAVGRIDSLSRPSRRRSTLTRRRSQFVGALLLAAVLPYVVRSLTIPGAALDPPNANAFFANLAAVTIAMWVRLSIATYPGIRSSYVIFPRALAAHGTVIAFLLMLRLPYDRLALLTGFLLHVLWNYAIYFLIERRMSPRIAIVPFGDAERLTAIPQVEWATLRAPRL